MTAAFRREDDPPSVRLRAAYLAALSNAGVIPLVAPPGSPAGAAELMSRCDGLVLTGGEDVAPALYGATPHTHLGRVAIDRDEWETALVLAARSQRTPVLAICRGIQLLNVALGGTLVQDLPSERPSGIDHDPPVARSSATHGATIAAGSRLATACGQGEVRVNSLHHQAIATPASGLRVVATAPDGTIEGVEAIDTDWWCVGVQWHPEDLVAARDDGPERLFEAFARVCRERAAVSLAGTIGV